MKHLLVQVHANLINGIGGAAIDKYYENLWTIPHYKKPDAFWELPKWAGELTYALKKAGQTDIGFKVLDCLGTERKPRNKQLVMYCSVMECNKDYLDRWIECNPDALFIVGGYIDWEEWSGSHRENVHIFTSIENAMNHPRILRSMLYLDCLSAWFNTTTSSKHYLANLEANLRE